MVKENPFPVFAITNPNKAWVSAEIDKLIGEWTEWYEYSKQLGESSDYDPRTCTEAIKDGWENRHKHEILREKTLVFMRNHFSGAEFVLANWKPHPHEDVTSRLSWIIPGWIHRLEILKASMEYVQVPEGYWKNKGKEFIDALTQASAEKAPEIAASWLKNPFGNE